MKKYSITATIMKLYPINKWAYISESKVDRLLGLLYDGTFVSNEDYDIISQVYNYLNVIYEHIKENNWFIYSPDRQSVAFNTYLKPRLELGDDYIFAQFKKNKSQFKQEWELEYFSIRGRHQGTVNFGLDKSVPLQYKPISDTKLNLSFGFNHLFIKDKDRIGRFPSKVLDAFTDLNDESQKRMLCSLIKFSILNDHDNISRYKVIDGTGMISTSFDDSKFLPCKNSTRSGNVLNELPYSFMYPVCLINPHKPDCAMIFRKQYRGLEGIIPAIESSHAVAYGIRLAKEMSHGSVLICLSGRGDKDMDYIIENYGAKYLK